MYTDFAAVYDRLMQDVDYDAWADYYAAVYLREEQSANAPAELAA